MQNLASLLNIRLRGIRILFRMVAIAAIAGIIPSLALAGSGLVTRTELYRSDLQGSETEIIVAQLELMPGATVPRHSHHGTEHLVVLHGGTMAMANGDAVEFRPGMTMDFARDVVHGGLTATGDEPIVVLTIHIVDKNAPLNVAAQ
jgi:quercetin dioxygenase-like cupin family protein